MIIKKSNSFGDARSSPPFLDSDLECRPPFKLPFFLFLFLSVVLAVALSFSLYSLSSLRTQLVQQQLDHESQIQQVQQTSYDDGYAEGYRLGHMQGIIDHKNALTYDEAKDIFSGDFNSEMSDQYRKGYIAGYDDCTNHDDSKYNAYYSLIDPWKYYQSILDILTGKK